MAIPNQNLYIVFYYPLKMCTCVFDTFGSVRIRIYRIHMFLSLPDPLVRGKMDPDPDHSIILLSSSKNSKKDLVSYCFETSFALFISEKWCTFKKYGNKQKNCFLKLVVASWRSMMKIAGSGSASGSISQRLWSADPDPDLYQNVMDPEHWLLEWCM